MALYAVAIIPLMLMIIEITANAPEEPSKVAAYADDFTVAFIVNLRWKPGFKKSYMRKFQTGNC